MLTDHALPGVLFITGTDTGVGKTIATAAIVASLRGGGRRVAVYKPTQAGLEEGLGDIDVVDRLSGVETVREGIRLMYPMAPVAAAEREGVELPERAAHLETIRALAAAHDHVLVEGAGGLLVQLDGQAGTLADYASEVAADGQISVGTVVVCRAALGTLNHTELTLEALASRRVPVTGLVIGSWPAQPGAVEVSNRAYLEGHRCPLLASIPEGAGSLTPPAFRAAAPDWFVGSDG